MRNGGNKNAAKSFQFHKGAIKTRQRTKEGLRMRSFNSIKVRLRRVAWQPASTAPQFQFHKGAIKTQYERW